MYRIKFIPRKQMYQLHSMNSGAFEGTIEAITQKALIMGIVHDELAYAYRDMARNKTTVAEFGIKGHFLYSHSPMRKIA